MKLRYYTEDDYVNSVPCIYKHRPDCTSVTTVMISGKAPFDGSRQLTVKTQSGHYITRSIGGSDLTQVFYAMDTK